MPNRIIKESICTSDSLAELSWFEQALFFRLIVLADDFGCYDGRTAIIKGSGFPLYSVTEKQIAEGLSKLATAGIVNLYTVGGKPYLQLESWSKHQRIRDSKHKYPTPDERDDSPQVAAGCGKSPQVAAGCGLNPIQSKSVSVSESESKHIGASAPDARASQIAEIIGYLNQKAGTRYKIAKSTRRHINARLDEGFTVDDFKIVIDKKVKEWLNNPEMAKYLRPETLFGTKFEGYLNAPAGTKKSVTDQYLQIAQEEGCL